LIEYRLTKRRLTESSLTQSPFNLTQFYRNLILPSKVIWLKKNCHLKEKLFNRKSIIRTYFRPKDHLNKSSIWPKIQLDERFFLKKGLPTERLLVLLSKSRNLTELTGSIFNKRLTNLFIIWMERKILNSEVTLDQRRVLLPWCCCLRRR
jgi:hypothetical protein